MRRFGSYIIGYSAYTDSNGVLWCSPFRNYDEVQFINATQTVSEKMENSRKEMGKSKFWKLLFFEKCLLNKSELSLKPSKFLIHQQMGVKISDIDCLKFSTGGGGAIFDLRAEASKHLQGETRLLCKWLSLSGNFKKFRFSTEQGKPTYSIGRTDRHYCVLLSANSLEEQGQW